MSKYWYTRYNQTQNRGYSTTDLRQNKSPVNHPDHETIKKQYENSIANLQKKANKISQFATKITKIQDFYQLLCGQGQEFSKMGIRCYQHNNQLILYCVTDHKLLCANCMYSPPNQTTTSPKNNKTPQKQQQQNLSKSRRQLLTKPKHSQQPTSRHHEHQVKQYQKSSVQITSDIKKWQYQMQQNQTLISSCQNIWQNLNQQFIKTKQNLLTQLTKQYDKRQMQLSKIYANIKKQLQQLATQYQIYFNKIIQAYRLVKKLLIPNRFPIPCMKHSWFQYVRNIFGELPIIVAKEENNNWVKAYQLFGRKIMKKINNTSKVKVVQK